MHMPSSNSALMRALRFIAGAVLVAGAYWNISGFNKNSANLWPRDADPVVVQENRLVEIRERLLEAGFRRGAIAFVTPRDLHGEASTAEDDLNWTMAYYVMIPLRLERHTLDTPYVIADFSGAEPIAELGENFTKLYDANNGLILFKRRTGR